MVPHLGIAPSQLKSNGFTDRLVSLTKYWGMVTKERFELSISAYETDVLPLHYIVLVAESGVEPDSLDYETSEIAISLPRVIGGP